MRGHYVDGTCVPPQAQRPYILLMPINKRYLNFHGESDSDDSISDGLSKTKHTPKAKAYEKALIATQREMQLLREKYKALNTENKMLKQEIIVLKEELDAFSAVPAREKNDIATEMDLVKTLAKKYTALYEPFSKIYNDPNLFVSPRPSSEFLLPEKRFCGDATARRDGWLAQLYEFLPESLHQMVRNYSDFDTEFRAAAKTMRSAIIDRMRKAAPLIFKLHPDIFKPNYQRETVPQLIQLLRFPNAQSKRLSKSSRPPKHPPILFPARIRHKGSEGFETKLFQAPEIYLFMKALLFGLSSLDATDSKHGGPLTYGKQWDVTTLEKLPFYAIPLFALLTVFVISEDSDFCSKGSRSGRDWEDYYDYLRRQFHAAYKSDEFQNIMNMCQDLVFCGLASGKGKERSSGNTSDSGESEINWQMQALQLSDDEDTCDSLNDISANTPFPTYPSHPHDGRNENPPGAGPSTFCPMPTTYQALVRPQQRQHRKRPVDSEPTSHSAHDSLFIHPLQSTPNLPLPQQLPAVKRRSKISKSIPPPTSRSGLFPLPPPPTPTRSLLPTLLGVAADSDESDSQPLAGPVRSKTPVVIESSGNEQTVSKPAVTNAKKGKSVPLPRPIKAGHSKKKIPSLSPPDNATEAQSAVLNSEQPIAATTITTMTMTTLLTAPAIASGTSMYPPATLLIEQPLEIIPASELSPLSRVTPSPKPTSAPSEETNVQIPTGLEGAKMTQPKLTKRKTTTTKKQKTVTFADPTPVQAPKRRLRSNA